MQINVIKYNITYIHNDNKLVNLKVYQHIHWNNEKRTNFN